MNFHPAGAQEKELEGASLRVEERASFPALLRPVQGVCCLSPGPSTAGSHLAWPPVTLGVWVVSSLQFPSSLWEGLAVICREKPAPLLCTPHLLPLGLGQH